MARKTIKTRPKSGSRSFRTFARDLRCAVQDDNDELARKLVFELDIANILDQRFPENHFRFLCSLMRSRSFHRSKAAKHVLFLFIGVDHWNHLSSNQKRRLLCEIERLYPKVTASAWYLCFLATVLLGENFRNEQALNALLRLARVPREHARSLIPHGLEHIVTDSGNPALTAIALDKLRKMSEDPSAQVRYEVALSMARIEQSRL